MLDDFLELVRTKPLLVSLAAIAVPLMVVAVLSKVPLGYNLRNLAVRWPVTFLTALAFTLVVALLTVMLAFVNGMNRLTESSGQPGNVLVMSEGATDELFSTLIYSDLGDVERQPGVLPYDNKRQMCSKEVYIVVNQPVPAREGEPQRRRFMQVRGIEDPEVAGWVHGLELLPESKWFSDAGVQEVPGSAKRQAIQAVLGEGAARELGRDQQKPRLDVGDVFTVGPREWIVVGIMQSAGSTFGSEIWAKRQIVGPMFGKENYTSIALRSSDAKAAKTLADYLTSNYKKAALKAQPETEYYSKLSDTNQQFLVAIIFVAVIMAVGGMFGVMNTMFAAISQRTKDIGVLRLIGFARRQILVSFLLESVAIALIGGILGCSLGYLSNGWTATSIVSAGQGGGKSVVLRLIVDSNIVAAGLLFTLLMGVLGGLLPALSAMRLKPLESLR
jgi:ABC-type antimicrobial peptide transport system permease subunit